MIVDGPNARPTSIAAALRAWLACIGYPVLVVLALAGMVALAVAGVIVWWIAIQVAIYALALGAVVGVIWSVVRLDWRGVLVGLTILFVVGGCWLVL